MAVLHKDLTGAELHEPKGIETAASGDVYIADGAGSGAWDSVTGNILNLNEYSLTETISDISTASDRVYFHIPVKSEIISLSAVLDGAIATADAVLSIYINGVLFADSLTVPFAGSGAGIATDTSVGTSNTIAADSVVEIRTSGASDNAVKAFVQLRLRAKV